MIYNAYYSKFFISFATINQIPQITREVQILVVEVPGTSPGHLSRG